MPSMPSDDFVAELMELDLDQWKYYTLERYGLEKIGARELMKIATDIGIAALQQAGVNVKMPRLLSLSQFLAETLPPPPARVGGILPQGKLVVMGGAPKEGKGLLALEILHCVAEGIPVMGKLPVMPLSETECVVYFGMEDGAVEIKARLEKRGIDPNLPLFICSESFDLGRPEGFAMYESLLASLPLTPVLVFVDTLRKAYPSIKDYNDAAQIGPHVGRLCDWSHDNNCTTVLVHHTNKNPMATGVNRLSGSNAVASSADSYMVLFDKDDKEPGVITWKLEAAGRGGIGGNYRLRGDMETYHISIMDEDDSKIQEAKEKAEYIEETHARLLSLIEEQGEMTTKDISSATGISLSTLSRRLSEMIKAETISKKKTGGKGGETTYLPFIKEGGDFIHHHSYMGGVGDGELKEAVLNTFFGDIDEKTGAVEL